MATSYTDKQIQDWFSANPNATGNEIASGAASLGITAAQIDNAMVGQKWGAIDKWGATTTQDAVKADSANLQKTYGTDFGVSADTTSNAKMSNGTTTSSYTAPPASSYTAVAAAAPVQATAAPAAPVATYAPATQTWDNSMSTEGRLNGLLSADSTYMQSARTKALQESNSRGLLNSSLAATAGEQAAINSALPIAQADSSTYYNMSSANQNATNTAGQYNAGSTNTTNQFNASAQNAVNQFNTNWANDTAKATAAAQNSINAAAFDAETKQSQQTALNTFTASQSKAQQEAATALANLNNAASKAANDANNASALERQKLTAAATVAQNNMTYAQDIYAKLNAMPSDAAKYINDVSTATNVTTEAKKSMIDQYIAGMNQQQDAYRDQLNTISFAPGKYFDFSTATGTGSAGTASTGTDGTTSTPANGVAPVTQPAIVEASPSSSTGLLGSSSSGTSATATGQKFVTTGNVMYDIGNAANGVKNLYDSAGSLKYAIPGYIYAQGAAAVMNAINNYTPGQGNNFNGSNYSDNSIANNYQSNPSVGPGSGETPSTSAP